MLQITHIEVQNTVCLDIIDLKRRNLHIAGSKHLYTIASDFNGYFFKMFKTERRKSGCGTGA